MDEFQDEMRQSKKALPLVKIDKIVAINNVRIVKAFVKINGKNRVAVGGMLYSLLTKKDLWK